MESRDSAEITYFEPMVSDIKIIRGTIPAVFCSSVNNRIDMSLCQSAPIFSKYSDIDEATGLPKKHFKRLTWNQDSYEGTVYGNNLHGSGFYMTQRNGQRFFYDGLFYVNKLEGYGQVFYENGTHFQGLFKEHLRYGPGVLSYPDGKQDVGFWNGFKLVRLACVVGFDIVPALANTQIGKTKLLCNRYMVPLCDENDDVVGQILQNTGENEENTINVDGVLNWNIRNPNSLFFPKSLYDEQFFGEKDCTIKVLVDSKDETEYAEPEEQLHCDPVERSKYLDYKIYEINESLETFVAIKQNLSQKVRICQKCCEPHIGESSSQESYPPGSVNTTEDAGAIPVSVSNESQDITDCQKDINSEDITSYRTSASTLKEIVEDICICDEEFDEFDVDLQCLEEQLQNISTQERFYRNIRDELQKKLDRILEKEFSKQDYKFKLLKVNELWAWNNEDSLIEMQKHCFKHRNSEDMVNFSVPSLILGNRKEFGHMGSHEELCHKFLIACAKGWKNFVKECLRDNKVHPNLTDVRGNSAIFFASAKNQHDIISTLTNFGAKLDQLNDEQLSPLSMCLLKCIALRNNCNNWETAFFPETKTYNIPDLPKWYDVKSFLSMTSEWSGNSALLDQGLSQHHCSNLRIIDLFQRVSTMETKKGSMTRSLLNTSYVFDLHWKSTITVTKEETDNSIESELRPIYLTIMTLLDYGANPNMCEVPYPSLVLSLFSENPDLVKEVIKANADISVVIEENVSLLHIAASLNPCSNNISICEVLAKKGCKANTKTSPTHWEDRRSYFTGKLPQNFEIDDTGKNPLHLLCMRTDFEGDQSDYFCSCAKILLETNLDVKSTYLGHTPLSLAVLAGNVKLAQCLIKTNVFNPYEVLQYGMGNILTLYTLKRFENALSTDQCKAMLTALVDMNVNLLKKVGDIENAIVFAEDQDHYFEQFVEKDTKKEGKDTKKGGKDTKKGGKEKAKAKPKKGDKHSQAAVIREFMKNLARQTVIKQIQITVTETLYEFLEEDMLKDNEELWITLASQYLTPPIALRNLEHLVQSKKIQADRLNRTMVKNLLEFVNLHKKAEKKKKAVKSPSKKEKGKPEPKKKVEVEEDMEELAHRFEATLYSQCSETKFVTVPGLCDPSKYNICYHCLRGRNKELKVCPRCQMVQFCSVQCNKLNLKLKTQHSCNILFYDMPEEKVLEITKGVCLNELSQQTRDQCSDRLQKKREAKLIREEEKLLELWRKDTYGTKFLQLKPLLDKAASREKGKHLSWPIGLLKGLMERQFQKSPDEASFYSLEHILLKLQGKKRSDATIRTKVSCSKRSTLVGSSTMHSVLFDVIQGPAEPAPTCSCAKRSHHSKSRSRDKTTSGKKQEANKKFKDDLIQYGTDKDLKQFREVVGNYSIQEKSMPVIKKLKKVPERYQKFVEVIGTYFPDIDFSYWLLPYACCSDGQLYYKFCNNELFKESYSFS